MADILVLQPLDMVRQANAVLLSADCERNHCVERLSIIGYVSLVSHSVLHTGRMYSEPRLWGVDSCTLSSCAFCWAMQACSQSHELGQASIEEYSPRRLGRTDSAVRDSIARDSLAIN